MRMQRGRGAGKGIKKDRVAHYKIPAICGSTSIKADQVLAKDCISHSVDV